MNYIVNGEYKSPRQLKILAVREGILATNEYSWVKGMGDSAFTHIHCYEWLKNKKSHKFKIKKNK